MYIVMKHTEKRNLNKHKTYARTTDKNVTEKKIFDAAHLYMQPYTAPSGRTLRRMSDREAPRLFGRDVHKGGRKLLRAWDWICDQLISHVPDKWRCGAGPSKPRSKECRPACAPICLTCQAFFRLP